MARLFYRGMDKGQKTPLRKGSLCPRKPPLGVRGLRLQSDLATNGANPHKPCAARVYLHGSLAVPQAQGSHVNLEKVARRHFFDSL